MICEQLGETGLCVPLNAFNIGVNRGMVTCQSVGCEETCPVRGIMADHNQRLDAINKMNYDRWTRLNEQVEEVNVTGRELQALSNLSGIRALGARFLGHLAPKYPNH